MANSYLSLVNLTEAFEKKALVLVPNNRLRNHLLRAYALQQTAQAWIKPPILSLNQWLESLWQQLQSSACPYACVTIASPLQRQMLWEKAIAQSAVSAALLQPQALAKQADTALRNLELWELSELWDLSEQHPTNDSFIDNKSNTAQFNIWLTGFNTDLARQNAVTRETSYRRIILAFKEGYLDKLPAIYLEGFDDLPPLMQSLLAAATHKLVHQPHQTAEMPKLIRTQATTADDEIRAAALWSKAQLMDRPQDALIGVVIPNLGQCRDRVERIFTEVFEPTACLPAFARYTLPFNFSAGTPLGSTPLIYSLFELLNLHNDEWPLERACALLHSPFWGNAQEEQIARAHLTEKLRRLGRLSLSTSDLRFYMTQLEQKNPVFLSLGLSARLTSAGNLLRRIAGQKTAREWLNLFDEILLLLGWPGSRRLDSQEYQQLNQWFEVRDEFAALDSHCAPMNYGNACRYLRQLADKTPFQAQTPDSPIQILGALEAAGLQFSHLWVMNLSDNQWPAAPSPNPLLPLNIQREHNMPHASAERELDIARGLTERYRRSAPVVVFSSAQQDADSELRASALIRDIPLTPLKDIAQSDVDTLGAYYKVLVSQAQLETIDDIAGPALSNNEPVRGGSTLFKLQAACPFIAFAQLRLGAQKPDEPVIGFPPRERGNLLHESLAALWKSLRNSRVLRATGSDELRQLVAGVTGDVIGRAQQQNQRGLGNVYCALEQERLTTLLCEWLGSECDRPDFDVIAIEQEQTINFEGLELRLRIDRIDRFANGDRLLIDYKTGSASTKSWQSDRPGEPQLPLYAITAAPDDGVAAISFAVINRKQQSWEGLGELHDTSLDQPGVKPSENWALQLDEWQSRLQKLAQDFIAGDARVDFKDKQAQDHGDDLLPLHRFNDAMALQNYEKAANNLSTGKTQ